MVRAGRAGECWRVRQDGAGGSGKMMLERYKRKFPSSPVRVGGEFVGWDGRRCCTIPVAG